MIGCSLICAGAYRWGETRWKNGKKVVVESLYLESTRFMQPYLFSYEKNHLGLLYEDIENIFMPLLAQFRIENYEVVEEKEDVEHGEQEGLGGFLDDDLESGRIPAVEQESEVEDAHPTLGEMVQSPTITTPAVSEKVVEINRVKLQDFDYLRQNFFQVDNTTTVGSDLLNVNQLLGKDMTLKTGVKGPQILIYHTHSQEGYKDSVPGDPSTTIIGVGDYLEKLLEEKYGIEVLHHTGVYDLPSRDHAYSESLPNIEKILQENPTIEVVIDLHRDGVAEDRHLVTEVNGKPTAMLMFFNGLSKTTSQGELAYLPNPYIADNLALSFQMQLTAAEYYPGLNRKIYLKGYRYNLHLKPKSILVEVGAQTNTIQEAKNAMEPLADILGKVLYNGIYK